MTIGTEVRRLIIDFIALNGRSMESLNMASLFYNVSISSIWRYLRLVDNGKDFRPQRERIPCAPPMHPEHINLLSSILLNFPDLFYAEQIMVLRNLVGVDYSMYDLRDAMRRLKMTRKCLDLRPIEVDRRLQAEYIHLVRHGGLFSARMIRAIDETHCHLQAVGA